MKYLHLFLVFFTASNVHSQKFDFFGGPTLTKFYDLQNDAPYNRSTYSSDLGFFIGLGIEDLDVDDLQLRLSISYEYISGNVEARTGGIGGGRTTRAQLSKSQIGIGISPFELKFKKLRIETGVRIYFLLKENFSGTTTVSAGNAPETIDLKEDTKSFNSRINGGIYSKLKYDIKTSETQSISPFYSFYLGISNEFKMFPKATKSMRHRFGLGYNF